MWGKTLYIGRSKWITMLISVDGVCIESSWTGLLWDSPCPGCVVPVTEARRLQWAGSAVGECSKHSASAEIYSELAGCRALKLESFVITTVQGENYSDWSEGITACSRRWPSDVRKKHNIIERVLALEVLQEKTSERHKLMTWNSNMLFSPWFVFKIPL